ncbi:MAG: sugar transferase [Flavobacteriales bacterium]|nr:sugar transferase [Flavobacteriales bacterium]MCX7767951.1 sugar transferase [Flavobacteriales bacterium]MDW8410814.1 sugar transferase [Flavobacteriales bacterium]
MYKKIKAVIDVLMGILLFILLLPVFLTVAAILFVANNGQVFFVQERPGYKERLFRIIKFKTMRDAWGPDGKPLPDEERLTPVGRWIRKTSLDEIPQLINVIRGEMSFVGPRPLLVEYLPLYNDWQRRRHEVKPGITGWAQVNGRNAITWDQKFRLDLYYVEHQSFWLDLKILFLTVIKVIKGSGINQEGRATVDYFQGNPDSQNSKNLET